MKPESVTPQKSVRVFISSTFKDMHSERDYLVRFVFPELRERCLKRGIQLIDIDLRWGVTEQEAELGKALEVCLDEIEQCRPFFIGILGERYGWTPDSYQVPDYPQFDWLQSVESGYSITALEILHGVLRNPNMNENAFFFFRDPDFIKDIPLEKRPEIDAENEVTAQKLSHLKSQIAAKYNDGTHLMTSYPCSYAGLRFDVRTLEKALQIKGKTHFIETLKPLLTEDSILPKEAFNTLPSDVQQIALEYGMVYLQGLDSFGDRVKRMLWSAIDSAFPLSDQETSWIEIEKRQHELFASHIAEDFTGRETTLSNIREARSENKPIMLHGEAGCGKSALLAHLSQQYSKNSYVIQRYCGTTKGSDELHSLLKSILTELHDVVAFPLDDLDELSPAELSEKLSGVLFQIGDDQNVILILDGIEKLSEAHFSRYLQWIPSKLPQNVRLLLSTSDAFCLEKATERGCVPIEIPPLSREEKETIVSDYLWKFRKKLGFDSATGVDQMELLLSKQGSAHPFYLTLACEELRIFPRFEDISTRIQEFPNETPELIAQILERLEHDHSRELVQPSLSLIALSLYGLQENELLLLTKRSWEPILPQALWAGVRHSLSGLLNNPFLDRQSLFFFHQKQFRDAVVQRYIPNKNDQKDGYKKLADFGMNAFHKKDIPLNNTALYTGIYLLKADVQDSLKEILRFLNDCEDSVFAHRSPLFSELLDYTFREEKFDNNHPLVSLFGDFDCVSRKELITIILQKADYYQQNASGLWSEWVYENLSKRLKLLASKKNKDALWMTDKRASVLNNLNIFYSRNQKSKEAKTALNEAIRIRKKMMEKYHDEKMVIARALMGNYLNLSILLIKESLHDEALPYLTEANTFLAPFLDADQFDMFTLNAVLKIRGNLILLSKGKTEKDSIRTLFNETEAILKNIPPAYLKDIGIMEGYSTLLNNYAGFLIEEKDPETSSVIKRAVEIFEKLLLIRPDNERYIEAICTLKSNLGYVLMDEGAFSESETVLYEVFYLLKKQYRRNHKSHRWMTSYAKINRSVMTFWSQQQRTDKAAPFMFRAFILTRELFDQLPEHPEYKEWMTELSENLIFYFDQPKYQGRFFERIAEMTRLHTELTLKPYWLFSYIDLISDEDSTYSATDFELAEAVLAAHKESFTANFTLASMYLNEGDIKRAFVRMQAAVNLSPDEDLHPKVAEILEQEMHIKLRDMLFSQVSGVDEDEDEDEDEVEEDEDEEEDDFESEYSYLFDEAMEHWDEEAYEESLSLLEQYIQYEPADTEALSMIATLYFHFERNQEALETIQLVLSIKPSGSSWSLLGSIRMDEGDVEKAISAYEKACESDPKDADFAQKLMMAYYTSGDFKKACDMADTLLREDQEDDTALLYKGLCSFELERTQDTLEALMPLYERDECTPLALYCLGDSLIEINDYEKAVEVLREIPEDDINYATGWNNIAFAYKKLGKHEDAVAAADISIKAYPESANPYLHKGQCLMELGKFDEAKLNLSKAKKLGNKYADEFLEELKTQAPKKGFFGLWS